MRVRIGVVSFLFLSLAGTVLVAGPASAGSGSDTRIVSNEAEYRSAVTSLASATGPAVILLDADVTLSGATDPSYTGTQPLTIDGDGHTLSGGDVRRVLTSGPTAPLLTVTDIRVISGFSTESGGAVRWLGAVTVTHAVFDDNHVVATVSKAAGAIQADGVITVDDSIFTDNSVTVSAGNANGGAIYANSTGQVFISDSVFATNQAIATSTGASGGAVFATVLADVDRSVFVRNQARGVTTASGGAIRSSGTADITGSLLSTNHAEGSGGGSQGFGGAVLADTLNLTDSTALGNSAEGPSPSAGSALYGMAAANVTDSTVTDNGSPGVDVFGAINAPTATLNHATVASNIGAPANVVTTGGTTITASAIGDPIDGSNCSVGTVTGTASVASDGTCELPAGGANTTAADLLLGPARYNGGPLAGAPTDLFFLPTRYPLAGSPVVDRQGTGGCTDTLDERQLTRPFGPKCDAAATEATFEPHSFTDVASWVEDAIRWLASDVNDPSLVAGITPTTFRPSDPVSRAQVVRLLYRLAGAPDPTAYDPHPFTDVPNWVEPAVRWAYGEGIVTGETPSTFAPLDPITRGQVVRMIYRLAGSQDVSGIDPHPFTDVPNWVEDAVRWAANPDNFLPIATGITPTTFVAEDDITRGQVARMVYRLAITPAAWAHPEDAPATVPFQTEPVP